jgi:hypothetical protein
MDKYGRGFLSREICRCFERYMPLQYFPDEFQWLPNRNEIVHKIESLWLLKSLTDSNIEANFVSHAVYYRHRTLPYRYLEF